MENIKGKPLEYNTYCYVISTTYEIKPAIIAYPYEWFAFKI